MNNPVAIHGAAHLTLPRGRRGPLPLPLEGRRGATDLAVTLISLAPLRGERAGVRGAAGPSSSAARLVALAPP
jgi:hypothetical protein